MKRSEFNPLPQQAGDENFKKIKGGRKGLRCNGTNPRAIAKKQEELEKLANILADEGSYLNNKERAKALLDGLPVRALTGSEKRMVAEIQYCHNFSPHGINVLERLEVADDRHKTEFQKLLEQVKQDVEKARKLCRSG